MHMKKLQNGFIVPALVLVMVVLAGGWGIYAYSKSEKANMASIDDLKVATNDALPAAPPSSSSVDSTTGKAGSPVITWSYVHNPVVTERERMDAVNVSIDGKMYATGISDVGCGTEIEKSKLQPGQLSATLCGPYAGSGTEVSVYRDGNGYRIVATNVGYGANATAPLERYGARTVMNISASGTGNALSDAQFLAAASGSQKAEIREKGDINGDGYQDAIVQAVNCGASCSVDLVVVLNQNNTSTKLIAPTFSPAFMSSSAAKSNVTNVTIADNGTVSLTGQGLACTPSGSEAPCTQDKWSVVKTINYKWNGAAMVQMN